MHIQHINYQIPQIQRTDATDDKFEFEVSFLSFIPKTFLDLMKKFPHGKLKFLYKSAPKHNDMNVKKQDL